MPFEAKRADLEQELALRKAADRLPEPHQQARGRDRRRRAAGRGGRQGRRSRARSRRSTARATTRRQACPRRAAGRHVARGGLRDRRRGVSPLEGPPDGGYFVLRVDSVEPAPRRKPLDEVRPQLIDAWKAEQQADMARGRPRSCSTAPHAARRSRRWRRPTGLEVRPIQPVERDGPGDDKGLDPAAVHAAVRHRRRARSPARWSTGRRLRRRRHRRGDRGPSRPTDGRTRLEASSPDRAAQRSAGAVRGRAAARYRSTIDGAATTAARPDDQVPSGPAAAAGLGLVERDAPDPTPAEFAAALCAGRPQVVWTSLVADLETPVSAMLKLADGPAVQLPARDRRGRRDARPLLRSIGLKPDLIWRCRGERAEINRARPLRPRRVRARAPSGALDSAARADRARAAIELPPRRCRRWRPACSATWATTWCG